MPRKLTTGSGGRTSGGTVLLAYHPNLVWRFFASLDSDVVLDNLGSNRPAASSVSLGCRYAYVPD